MGRTLVLLAAFGGLLAYSGCRSTEGMGENLTRARFVLESAEDNGFGAVARMPISGVAIPLQPEAILSEYDYAKIELAELEFGAGLIFTLKPAAARAFYGITVANQGRRLVLLIDGLAMGARRIESPVATGVISIFLETTDENLEEIAAKLEKSNLEIQKQLSR